MNLQDIILHLQNIKHVTKVYKSNIKSLHLFDYKRPGRYCLITYKLNRYRGYLDGQVLSRNGNLVKSFRYLDWKYSYFFNSIKTANKQLVIDDDFDRSFDCMKDEALKYNAKEIVFCYETSTNKNTVYNFLILELEHSEEHIIERKKEQYIYQKSQIEHYNKALHWIDKKDNEVYKLHEQHCKEQKQSHNNKAKKLGKQLGIHVFGI